MKYEIKRKVINVSVDGNEHKLCIPTAKQVYEFEQKMKANDQAKYFDLIKDFMNELGLPMDLIDSLDIITLGELVDMLVGKKKI